VVVGLFGNNNDGDRGGGLRACGPLSLTPPVQGGAQDVLYSTRYLAEAGSMVGVS
jgi:hypothetical protein